MHYKNGREAKVLDPVIGANYDQSVYVGVIHSLSAGSDTCNCQVAVVIPGGVNQRCESVKALLHAEDGLKSYAQLFESSPPPPKA